MQAPLSQEEDARIQALRDYRILDTAAEADFDDFTSLAAHICGTPIALISLVDADRQWFKSKVGLDAGETPRDQAFCAHAIHHPGVFTVPDAQADARFADNPLVTGKPDIRFYAGAPLLTEGGQALGTLCVIDRVPRTLTAEQGSALQSLSRQVIARLELRRQLAEREQAERALSASEARKRSIVENALDCIITIDHQERVIEWNPAAERTFGYSFAEACGRTLSELIVPPTLRPAHARGIRHYLQTGEGPALNQRLEVPALRKDGGEISVELAATAVQVGENPLFTAYLRDISEQKQAEQTLRDQEEQYRLLFENATHGIYRTTPDGRILLANPALLEMLGYDSLEQLAARNLETEGTEAAYERADFKARLEAAGELRGLEATWERRDGEKIFVRENAHLVRDSEGGPLFYEGSVEDITARKEAEEALRRSEARFQRNAANAPGMMYQFVLHPDGSVEFPFVSDGCRDIYGMEPSEIMRDPMTIISILHPEDQAGFQDSVADSARTLLPWKWEGRFLLPSGEPRWVQGASRPERRPDGSTLWDGLLMDITERKAVQEALQRSHEELEDRVRERTAALAEANRALTAEIAERQQTQARLAHALQERENIMETVPDIIFRLDLRGRLVQWNRKMETMTGLSAGQLQGKPGVELFPAPEQNKIAQAIAQAFATGYAEVEGHLLGQGGAIVPHQFQGVPLRDSDGQVIGLTGTGRDITERLRVEEQVRATNDMRRLIMDNIPQFIFWKDQDSVYLGCNQNFARGAGLRHSEEIIGKTDFDLPWKAEEAEFYRAVDRDVMQGNTPRLHILETQRQADGHDKWLETNKVPLHDAQGRVMGILGTFQDVTERRRAEEQIRVLNAELTEAYDATIEGWSRALDCRDHETEGHSRRVTELTLRLARAVGISEEELVHVRRGALLHDIGKMGVPDRVLLKPGPLDDGEWEMMRRHPSLAHEILEPVAFLRPALDIPFCHHERWDGTGYPQCLRGEQIPLAARLFAVVDVWDALRSDRPYRKAWDRGRVLDHIRGLAGTHFDPQVVRAFLSLMAGTDERPLLALAA